MARLMRENAIRAKTVKNRQFSAQAPNRVWAGDITYVFTKEGWLYLAVVLDLDSRAAIGWGMGSRLTAELATEALTMVLWRRKPKPGLLHHSDRGVQYASQDYQRALAEAGISCSMRRKANCWDNACVESFFGTLKKQLVHDRRYLTGEEAKRDIFEWIEVF